VGVDNGKGSHDILTGHTNAKIGAESWPEKAVREKHYSAGAIYGYLRQSLPADDSLPKGFQKKWQFPDSGIKGTKRKNTPLEKALAANGLPYGLMIAHTSHRIFLLPIH